MSPSTECRLCKLAGKKRCVSSIHPEQVNSTTNDKLKLGNKPLKAPNNGIKINNASKRRRKKAGNKKADSKLPISIKETLNDYKVHGRKVKVNVIKSLKRRGINSPHRYVLKNCLGLKKNSDLMCAANIEGRIAFQNIFVDEVISYLKDEVSFDDYDWFSITFCDDRFITLERKPVLDCYALNEKVRSAFRHEPEFNYISALDVNIATNFPRNKLGNCMMFHHHCLAWVPKQKKGKKRRPFSDVKLRSFNTILSKKAIKVDRLDSISDLMRFSAYTVKPPYWGKTIGTSKIKKTGEIRINMEDDPLPQAMRFLTSARVLSHLELDDIFVSKNVGSIIIRQAIKELESRMPRPSVHRRNHNTRVKKRERIRRAWNAAQTNLVKVEYLAPIVRVTKNDPKLLQNSSKSVEPWLKPAVQALIRKRKTKISNLL